MCSGRPDPTDNYTGAKATEIASSLDSASCSINSTDSKSLGFGFSSATLPTAILFPATIRNTSKTAISYLLLSLPPVQNPLDKGSPNDSRSCSLECLPCLRVHNAFNSDADQIIQPGVSLPGWYSN